MPAWVCAERRDFGGCGMEFEGASRSIAVVVVGLEVGLGLRFLAIVGVWQVCVN